ncbi:MAG: hypothetical protein AB8C95_02790 [Phycisphaeraceae bacterium]
MQNNATRWIALLVICLMTIGCGGESTTQEQADADEDTRSQEDAGPVVMVLETSEPTYWRDGQAVSTIEEVRTLVIEYEPEAAQNYTIEIDGDFKRAGQLRLVLEQVGETDPPTDLSAQAAQLFDQIQLAFNQKAKDAAMHEEGHLRGELKNAISEVTRLQAEINALQQILRGVPSTDESRLERRKLNRQLDNILVTQIALEKSIEQAKRRNDRERYVTLLRVR